MPESVKLSPRELQVLILLGDGLSNKDIAIRLNISVLTVAKHTGKILKKMRVQSRTEAAVVAIKKEMI